MKLKPPVCGSKVKSIDSIGSEMQIYSVTKHHVAQMCNTALFGTNFIADLEHKL